MNSEQETLVDDLDTKIAAAITANDALIEYERTTAGSSPRVAFKPVPSAEQLARWRAYVAAVKAGTRTAELP